LADFYVFVSEAPFQSTSLQTTLQQAGVHAFYFAGPASTLTSFPIDRLGRYVRVQLSGTNYLQLAEVQVFSDTWDTDRDGLPDYLEDRNGNGSADSGETDWQNPSDLGFKVWITEPKGNSNVP
jgi:hypothetical protein